MRTISCAFDIPIHIAKVHHLELPQRAGADWAEEFFRKDVGVIHFYQVPF